MSPFDQSLASKPDIEHLVTEDGAPVDNIFSEKQQRLLTEPLHSSWAGPGQGRPFLAAANVGVFPSVHESPLVPDMFLSVDVEVPDDLWPKENRSYFIWKYGKPPDVVVEVVSNREGGETTTKVERYARMRVPYYVVYDPQHLLLEGVLLVHEIRGTRYATRELAPFPGIGLALCLWEGIYEGCAATWLRWCDESGRPIPTGAERAEQERARAEQESARAEQERARAERLAARLRELGEEPEEPR